MLSYEEEDTCCHMRWTLGVWVLTPQCLFRIRLAEPQKKKLGF